MSLKSIFEVFAVLAFVLMLPAASYAQENGSSLKCATDESRDYFFESFVSDVALAYENAEQEAKDVQDWREILESSRVFRTKALAHYNDLLDAIAQANQVHAVVVSELSSAITLAGGEIVTIKGETIGFGIHIPPFVRFSGGKFNMQNNRLLRMREYIQGMAVDLQRAGNSFEHYTEEIISHEEAVKDQLEEFAISIDELERRRRILALHVRLCEDQSERAVENWLISGEPDIPAPEPDTTLTSEVGGILDDDQYWIALATGDSEALFDMMIDDKTDEGASEFSSINTGSPTIEESRPEDEAEPDQAPVKPETIDEVSETNEQSEATGNAPASDEDDYGIPGTEDPRLPSAGPTDSDVGGVAAPDLTAIPAAQTPIVAFPGLGDVNLNDVISSDVLAALEAINATGVNLSSLVLDIQACGWDANLICSRFASLSGPDLNNCLANVEEARTMCTSRLQRKGQDLSVARCQADCETMASEARAGLTLYQLAQTSLQAITIDRLQDQQNLNTEHDLILARLVALENDVQNRQLHIYVHAETGEMTIHDGPYFEPQPPLVYSGTSQRPPTTEQIAALVDLSAQLSHLEQALADIGEQLINGDTWENAAFSHWDAIIGKGSSDSCLTVPDIVQPLSQCRANCSAQGEPNEAIGYPGPFPQEFCRLSSNMLAAMMDPDAERWL